MSFFAVGFAVVFTARPVANSNMRSSGEGFIVKRVYATLPAVFAGVVKIVLGRDRPDHFLVSKAVRFPEDSIGASEMSVPLSIPGARPQPAAFG